MIGSETMAKNQTADACAARQSAQSVLKQQAEHMRRRALRMIQEADQLDQLANVMAGLSGPAEEALWQMAINSPRPY
jgi:hypothetical protein